MMKMNWIICPVRSGFEKYTKPAIESFLAQDIADVYLLLIDNDESDQHMQLSEAQICKIFRNRPGLGVAASWNQALRYVFYRAGAFKSSHALVVNNDVLLRPDTYRWLREDGGGFVTAVGVVEKERMNSGLPSPEAKRPHPDFSCFLIRKWVYELVGSFDENFIGAYAEDADYHVRMHKVGVKAYCLDLPFLHYASGTIKTVSSSEAVQIHRQADKNRAYFEKKWGCKIGSEEYYRIFEERLENENA